MMPCGFISIVFVLFDAQVVGTDGSSTELERCLKLIDMG